MTTTYIMVTNKVKQLNPAGSCFFDIPYLWCRLRNKGEKTIRNKKKIVINRAKQTNFYTQMYQRVNYLVYTICML